MRIAQHHSAWNKGHFRNSIIYTQYSKNTKDYAVLFVLSNGTFGGIPIDHESKRKVKLCLLFHLKETT